MTLRRVLWQSLAFYRRSHVAVLACIAVGAAVLAGALLVGDSMRGSLRELTLDRLGRVDFALRASRLFREGLAEDLSAEPAIGLAGNASRVDDSGQEVARAGRVQVWGVRREFWNLARERPVDLPFQNGESADKRDAIVLNEALADELDVSVGDDVLVRVQVPSDIPREAVLGRKDDTVRTLRMRVTGVAGRRGGGMFGLDSAQRSLRNAFVPLNALQQKIGTAGKANTMLVSASAQSTDEPADAALNLQATLAARWRLEDLGLRLRTDGKRGYLSLESSRMALEPVVADAALEIAHELNVSATPVLAYLANSIARDRESASARSAAGSGYSVVELVFSPLTMLSIAAKRAVPDEPRIPYSTVAAVPAGDERSAGFRIVAGQPLREHGEDEILLNEWAADDLGVKPGDRVRVSYFVAEPAQPFETAETTFVVRGVVAIDGLAADPGLVPEYPGITDAERYADWDPPFPMDLKRVRAKDEEYWNEHRATPKMFVSLETGERLWGSRFGKWTSIRLAPDSGASGAASLDELSDRFAKELLARLRPEKVGFEFQPVKAQGLAAASGATDFAQLFLAFSFFLIVAAAILVGLVFRLSAERRAKQVGLLLAVGFDRRGVTRLFLAEGLIVACVGSVVGTAGGVCYAWLVMAGLRSWWLPAVGTSLLQLHVTLTSLALGTIAGLVLAVLAIVGSLRGLMRLSPRELLAGSVRESVGRAQPAAAWLRPVAWVAILVSLMLTPLAFFSDVSAPLFFAIGTTVLVAGLLLIAAKLSGGERTIRGSGVGAVVRLGARNAERNRGRSLLTAGLIACATFVIVAVGANRRPENAGTDLHRAKTGGFSLVAETDVPLLHDLNSRDGRREFGFTEEDDAALGGAKVYPFRVLPGDDASCLNLYQPTRPRILGASPAMIERGGFRADRTQSAQSGVGHFELQSSPPQTQGAATTHVRRELKFEVPDPEHPWRLLDADLGPNVVPALGDANSVRWILKLGVGKRLPVMAEDGRAVELQIAATLSQSIFQSELVISENNFRRLFPSRTGYSYFLIEEPSTVNARLSTVLEQRLSDFGFDATTVAGRLAEYHAIENTYLSTFQMLGGLGLVLGTLGLGAVLLRNVLERRGELALLQAVGFRPASLVWLVLSETLFLLVAGLGAGATAALVAVAPHVLARAGELPWASLAGTLAAVLACGAASAGAAVFATLRTPLLPALRVE